MYFSGMDDASSCTVPEKYLNIWIMYDVYDLKADGYLPQKQVKALAAEVGVPYMVCAV